MEPAPPPPRQQDGPPPERSVAPAMYHHLPYRTRHHRPYEPFDTALHHHSTRSTAHAPARQEYSSESVHRRTATTEVLQQGRADLDVMLPPTLPRRHARRMPTSGELAERAADRRRREEARDAVYNARYAYPDVDW